MIRVLHLITSLSAAGAEGMLYRLLGATDRTRFQPVVVSLTDGGELRESIEDLGVEVLSLGMKAGIPNPAAIFRLRAILRDRKPHLLQTWLYHADLLGLIAAKCPPTRSLPVIWNLRCADMRMNEYSLLSRLTLKSLSLLSRFPDAIISNSERGKSTHVELGYRARRWIVIPNGFDIETFRPDPGRRSMMRDKLALRQDAVVIGLIARYDPMKDHDTFLRAASLILRSLPGTKFLLAGEGVDHDNVDLVAKIRGYELEESVVLLGPRRDVPALLNAMDLMCLSSVSEAFPNVVGEAMASGVPCVVTDVGDARTILGNTGRVVPIRDPEAIAESCLELISSAQLERLGERARERVSRCWSIGAIADSYARLYTSLSPVERRLDGRLANQGNQR